MLFSILWKCSNNTYKTKRKGLNISKVFFPLVVCDIAFVLAEKWELPPHSTFPKSAGGKRWGPCVAPRVHMCCAKLKHAQINIIKTPVVHEHSMMFGRLSHWITFPFLRSFQSIISFCSRHLFIIANKKNYVQHLQILTFQSTPVLSRMWSVDKTFIFV